MTPAERRNRRRHWARIVAFAILASVTAWGFYQGHQADQTNRKTIRAIQHDRTLRIAQINEAAITLCTYSQDNRKLQRQSISEQPAVVAARARATGATPREVAAVRALTQARTDRLLVRYPAIVCPSSFVDLKNAPPS